MNPIYVILIGVFVGIGLAILAGRFAERKLRQNAKDNPTKFKK